MFAQMKTEPIKGREIIFSYPDAKYTPTSLEGFGCSSYVFGCHDNEGSQVAIKMLLSPFDDSYRAKKTYRELAILQHMNHPNVIKLLDAYTTSTSARELCNLNLVFSYFDQNLDGYVKNNKGKLSEGIIQKFTYQLMCGLQFIHSAGVVHRDLKPDNIGIYKGSQLKIIDFGLARLISNYEDDDTELTKYPFTECFRAPEFFLFSGEYDNKVDIWSIGNIFAFMYLGSPLIAPKTNQLEEIREQLRITGPPDEVLLAKLKPDIQKFFQNEDSVVKSDLSEIILGASPNALSMLNGLLVLDPNRRLSAKNALSHPFLRDLIDDNAFKVAELIIPDASFSNKDATVEVWKDRTWRIILDISTREV